MITSSLLFAVQSTIEWNPSVALVMLFCNLFAIVIGRFAIKNPGSGPDLPIPKPALWKNFGVPELIATTSLGHILGAGMILGLANAGAL
ncbi:MAG: photosystem I reaction center subunit PsaK [Prochloraceae cyanobacterium]|nr:photosystem I reaction center subunit PsaK [Prochloraceae cyanobacterium]